MAISLGMPNDLYWNSTPEEILAVLERVEERERRENMRVGLIAATICNVHRKKGSRPVYPQDFFREPPRQEDYMDVEFATTVMDRWTASINKEFVS